MNRREFFALLGGAAAWPLAVRAQQGSRIPRVGVLWHAGNAEQEGSNFTALVKGFADLGYVEDRTIVLENRFPNERPDQFRSMPAELVASGVDVLVAVGANALRTPRKRPPPSRWFSPWCARSPGQQTHNELGAAGSERYGFIELRG
ncbi:MAG: hypothetical protein E6G78_18535 [Alphaproteobacteria bacterium]|nr:MAG: hypothetical protein E6G78_18535 [Alphaproteobacteria bacterium]